MSHKSLRLRITCPKKILGEPIIHKLSHDCKVVPNIVRGRITQKSAWLEVDLAGTPANMKKALKFLARRGVRISRIDG